ncbi:hypothetical protein F8388_006745 [Cannabis sativa]|uniref:Peroxisomal membrane protein PEX16 n=1 Tax=Cannabis sativa TaxID=3483 RepID=A0A7J6GWS8_CANSA|nr:hypothetical protein F8388_006745 [Cannabis sativa]KAF4397859.1 hypothetical protein G4B88_019580 [Cannabis sativa]
MYKIDSDQTKKKPFLKRALKFGLLVAINDKALKPPSSPPSCTVPDSLEIQISEHFFKPALPSFLVYISTAFLSSTPLPTLIFNYLNWASFLDPSTSGSLPKPPNLKTTRKTCYYLCKLGFTFFLFVEVMEAYKRWVRENKEYVQSLESLANGLTWLLPERFSTSEIGPEAVTAIFGIITAINEHIIETAPPPKHVGPAEPNSFPYPLCISALKELETLVEVAAEDYFGEKKKWNFIALMEATKVIVKLALFRSSGYKMLILGGETPNDDKHLKPSPPPPHEIDGFAKPVGNQRPGYLRNNHGQNPWNLEGRALSALNRFGENARTVSNPAWLHRVQRQHAIIEPPSPVVERPTLSTVLAEKGLPGVLFIAGEVLFITRPLIYVLFIRKYGIRSWIPWFLSFSVDLIGSGILSQVTSQVGGKKWKIHLSAPEQQELKRRKVLWAFYLVRDPFFTKYIRQRLERTEKVLEPVPAIGFLTGKIVELLIGAQTRTHLLAQHSVRQVIEILLGAD